MKKIALFSAFVLVLASCRNAEKYDATGLFEATTVTVSSETAGKLVSFDINEGDSLIGGQQVGLVDTTLLALQRKQLLSQQLSTEKSSPDIAAQAAALRSQIAHQQNECDRIARLLANGAAATGKKTTIFFTFWGLNVIKKEVKPKVEKDIFGKMFGKDMGIMPVTFGDVEGGMTVFRIFFRYFRLEEYLH